MALSTRDAREQLRQIDLFRECGDDDLDRVAALALAEARFEPGEVLYREGDPARDCYVIVEGETDVTVSNRFVGNIGEGESVGEMGLLDQAPRTATVVARTPVRVQVIDAKSFDRLLDEAPSVTRALLRQVSRWLRARGETIARLAVLADEITLRVGVPTPVSRPAPARPEQVGLDPDAPGFYDNPYEQYAVLREHAPVHFDAKEGTWLVSRYEDVLAFGRNKELTVEIDHASPSSYVDKERVRLERMAGRR
jgi:CRP-like cAMP-binding protein